MSDEIDRDAELIGINPKIWKEFRGMTDQNYVQEDLPYFQQQDDKEAEARHRASMAKRWFGYYKKCTDQQKKFKLIDQYNSLAKPRERE